jgi:hypothetical protein
VVSAVKKAICFCLLAWMSLRGLAQAQSGPDAPRLRAHSEIPSSLVAALPSQPRNGGEPYRSAPVQKFVCNTGYTQKQCNEDVLVLRKALANYPLTQLGDWTWILVRSENWKAILLPKGLDPDSPAFTFYPKRETFIEEALVTQVPVRNSELLLKWNMDRMSLLDLAIRHELGHALCNDANERNADRVAKLLEQRKTISCQAASKVKPTSTNRRGTSKGWLSSLGERLQGLGPPGKWKVSTVPPASSTRTQLESSWSADDCVTIRYI